MTSETVGAPSVSPVERCRSNGTYRDNLWMTYLKATGLDRTSSLMNSNNPDLKQIDKVKGEALVEGCQVIFDSRGSETIEESKQFYRKIQAHNRDKETRATSRTSSLSRASSQ